MTSGKFVTHPVATAAAERGGWSIQRRRRLWIRIRPRPTGFKRCGCGWSGLAHYSPNPEYICEPREVSSLPDLRIYVAKQSHHPREAPCRRRGRAGSGGSQRRGGRANPDTMRPTCYLLSWATPPSLVGDHGSAFVAAPPRQSARSRSAQRRYAGSRRCANASGMSPA